MPRVLVVDDNPEMLESRKEAIAAEGHTVTVASTVDDALGQLPADFVVADLRVPEVEDGLRLIREVRRRTPAARIIVSSGFTGYLDGRAEKAMVEHALQKPYPTARLLALLRMAVVLLAAGIGAMRAGVVEDHAPILERRANAAGTQSDVPLMMYAERLRDEGGAEYLQYTVIFSNEDGGTSTPALLARWGRTTDIEHVYRVWVTANGERVRATIQTRAHKDVNYDGPFEGNHPVLGVITDNNMVGPGGSGSGERMALKPVEVDLSGASREMVMDGHPETYRAAAEELAREGKVTGLVGDAREYLYIEAKVVNRNTRVAARVRLGERWYGSSLGRFDWAIERSGWVRTAVRLPGVARADEVGIECLAERDKAPGTCTVEAMGKVFRLDGGYRPGEDRSPRGLTPVELQPGEMRSWKLR